MYISQPEPVLSIHRLVALTAYSITTDPDPDPVPAKAKQRARSCICTYKPPRFCFIDSQNGRLYDIFHCCGSGSGSIVPARDKKITRNCIYMYI